ncbi:MAG: DUF1045 domain-containing protein [Roseobacter sp.]
MFKRYAVYFTPEGTLAEVGAAWLGWNVVTGKPVAHPAIKGMDVQAITDRPRKYGLHGTIKPPFYLAHGRSTADLLDALQDLCAEVAPVTLDGLQIRQLGKFFVLTPIGDSSALAVVAAKVVKTLDHFRAPPSEEELERRRKSHLSASQEENLLTWGYPYVMDDFRFHITLTGRIKKDADLVETALQEHFNAHLPNPFHVNSLTLTGQDEDGMFHEIRRFGLGT